MRGFLLQLALAALIGLVVSSHSVPVLEAKGPVDKIMVSRIGMDRPVEITSVDALDALSPWRDDFLGKKIQIPPAAANVSMDTGFQVWLYIDGMGQRPAEAPGLRADPEGMALVYYVDYYPDPTGTTPGFILLHDEARTAALNNSTIIRPTGWYEATPAWKDLLADFPGTLRPPMTGDAGLASR